MRNLVSDLAQVVECPCGCPSYQVAFLQLLDQPIRRWLCANRSGQRSRVKAMAQSGVGKRFLDREPALKNQSNWRVLCQNQVAISDRWRWNCGGPLLDLGCRVRSFGQFLSELHLDVPDLELTKPRCGREKLP